MNKIFAGVGFEDDLVISAQPLNSLLARPRRPKF